MAGQVAFDIDPDGRDAATRMSLDDWLSARLAVELSIKVTTGYRCQSRAR